MKVKPRIQETTMKIMRRQRLATPGSSVPLPSAKSSNLNFRTICIQIQKGKLDLGWQRGKLL